MTGADVVRIGSLCSGFGGLDLAVQAATGGRLAWAADPQPGPAAILARRFPRAPNLGDVRAIDWHAVPRVDVLAAGFPCQDISHAGGRAGIQKGNRSGIWTHVADALGVLRPRLVVLENVAAIAVRRPGLDVVLADLAARGFDAQWGCLRASDIGAPHRRNRWFLLAAPAADSADHRRQRPRATRLGRTGSTHRHQPPAHPTGPGWSTRDARRGVQPVESGAGGVGGAAWGRYAAAIARWEHVTGQPAPEATEAASRAGRRLSARFVEWLMGLEPGWVTDVPGLTRAQQLHALGNGVIPLQALTAVRWLAPLLSRMQGDLA
ncbi:MAG: DNA cytosine methyltransferase [Stackebrandtia sp.]